MLTGMLGVVRGTKLSGTWSKPSLRKRSSRSNGECYEHHRTPPTASLRACACSTFVLLSPFFWRPLDTHRDCRKNAYFTYEKRGRHLTRMNRIKSVISGF
jgi:hypothetical protein